MVTDSEDLYWDSCVLIRWLTGRPAELQDDLDLYIKDAKAGDRRIHISTITLAEISSGHLKLGDYGDIHDLLNDLRSALKPITPSPPIMAMTGQIRSNKFHRDKGERILDTPDAIHLITAIHLRDELGVQNLVFHSFDEGKRRGPEGKCVPLIGFENWTARCRDDPLVKRVLALPRELPHHPKPELPIG